MHTILTADIGGTNSRFAHFEAGDDGPPEIVKTLWLKTGEAASFANLLEKASAQGFAPVMQQAAIAAFAVAGPVEEERFSNPPWISWDIDLSVNCPVHRCFLINDFLAQAYACQSPIIKKALEIAPGNAVPGESIGVIGAGTGLGHAVLVPLKGDDFVAVPSEGGHASFSFENKREDEYRDFILREMDIPYATGDIVVSGRGLSLLHRFLTGERLEPAQVSQTFGPESETLEWMARFFGRACRNFALYTLPRGGIYVAGGLAARAPMLVMHEAFIREFRTSGTMASLLKEIPLFLNTNEESGLWGAAVAAVKRLRARKDLS